MKRHNMKFTLKGFLAGILFTAGSLTFAGSVTVSGTTGTNSTYIVIPEEYAGKEGQFVATATSSNTNKTTCANPYIDQNWAYVTKNKSTCGAINYTLTTPSGIEYQGSSKSLPVLEKGSYRVSLTQNLTGNWTRYSLYKNYWADTEEQTFSDMLYYAQNGKLPASPGIKQAPGSSTGTPTSSKTGAGLTLSSSYIVVYGVDDGGSGGEVTPPVTGGDSSGGSNIDINITTGTDDGVYTLINSLFSYISEMQSILSASDEAIHSELASYITELQTAYQAADSESDQCAAGGNVNQCFGSADFAGKSDFRIAESDEFFADTAVQSAFRIPDVERRTADGDCAEFRQYRGIVQRAGGKV